MNESLVSAAVLDRLFRAARSFNDFTDRPVKDDDLHTLYVLA
jgi:hypothetical protein